MGDVLELGKGAIRTTLPLSRVNRHVVVTGATGTGKTVSLLGIAARLSACGVPVFFPDVKRNARTLNRLRRKVAPDLFREVRFPIRTQSAMFANRIEESRREIDKIRDVFEGRDGFSEGLGID